MIEIRININSLLFKIVKLLLGVGFILIVGFLVIFLLFSKFEIIDKLLEIIGVNIESVRVVLYIILIDKKSFNIIIKFYF